MVSTNAILVVVFSVCLSIVAKGTESLTAPAFYDVDGPLPITTYKETKTFPCNTSSDPKRTCSLSLTLSYPTTSDQQFPFILMYDGFKIPSWFYSVYATRLATWGYVVLQYDTKFVSLVPDIAEASFFPLLRDWVMQSKAAPVTAASQAAIVGHSRGGKLTGLALSKYASEGVTTGFMIDPVDVTQYTPESPNNPSAVKALKNCTVPFAVIGAGVGGSCNPKTSNYTFFWSVARPGSWLLEIPQAGHMQVTYGNWAERVLLDLVCGSGDITHENAMLEVAVVMLSWLDTHFRPQERQAQLEQFKNWTSHGGETGDARFTVRSGSVVHS